jgi:PAS domain S-box-containing protein
MIALRGTVQDITERKQAEQALADTQAAMLEQQKQARLATLNQMQDANAARAKAEAALAALHESREQLKLFIEHAPASLAMLDNEMRYLAVSRRWLTEYAIGDREILGHSHYEIFPEIDEAWKAIHRRGLQGEVIHADGDRFERADGSVQWIRWEVRPWTAANGSIGGIVIFSEDITSQKLAEDEIHRLNTDLERRVVERTAELSAANHELDSFAYAVSHDLRAPLRAMSGFSQALLEDYGNQLADDAKKYLYQIGIASHRMSDLIDGILALSRSTRGDLRRDRIDVSALASQRLATLAGEDPSRQVSTRVESGLTVEGDARMIESVIDNLIDNAWKYTGKASAPEIRVYGETREGSPWICITDNGAGFDLAHAERLFKPFQRLHRQDEFPGIGIGLATVQRIIHRHGGEIEAHGKPNLGATFCFKLPPAASLKESE